MNRSSINDTSGLNDTPLSHGRAASESRSTCNGIIGDSLIHR
jgi:hypothetical protein